MKWSDGDDLQRAKLLRFEYLIENGAYNKSEILMLLPVYIIIIFGNIDSNEVPIMLHIFVT